MTRRKIALVMTIGTADGEHGAVNKPVASIKNVRPDYIVFFASEESKVTIDSINELILDDYEDYIEGEDYEINIIKDIDDYNECYNIYLNRLLEIYKNYKIVADFTSGTKTMSASLATCAILFGVDLISVTGLRDKGFVKAGTETIRNHNVFSVKDSILRYLIGRLFNNYRYDEAIVLTEQLIAPELNKEDFINILKVYSHWDNVRFQEARELLSEVNLTSPILNSIKKNINENLKALSIICTSHSDNLKNCYILASLINNARRRSDEYKYDDAIARLYRSFELIAQIRLNKFGITSSNVDVNILKENNVSDEFINYLQKFNEDGKIRIGLVSDYLLLNELNDELGKYFVENRKAINDITVKRNNSILAHGLNSNTKEDYEKFEEIVLELAFKLDKSMKRFLFETQFPKFDLD